MTIGDLAGSAESLRRHQMPAAEVSVGDKLRHVVDRAEGARHLALQAAARQSAAGGVGDRHGRQKLLRIGMLRIAEHLACRAGLDDLGCPA